MNGAQIGMIQRTIQFLQIEIPKDPIMVPAVLPEEDHGVTWSALHAVQHGAVLHPKNSSAILVSDVQWAFVK